MNNSFEIERKETKTKNKEQKSDLGKSLKIIKDLGKKIQWESTEWKESKNVLEF